LEAVVPAKRDKAAALKFLKRTMKKYGRPLSVVTDGLCSYPAAMKAIGNADRREAGRRLNNRAENSHQPFRRRERAMQRFRRVNFRVAPEAASWTPLDKKSAYAKDSPLTPSIEGPQSEMSLGRRSRSEESE